MEKRAIDDAILFATNKKQLFHHTYIYIYFQPKTSSSEISLTDKYSRMGQLKLETWNFNLNTILGHSLLVGCFPGSRTSGAWKRKRECCTTVCLLQEEKKVDDTREMARTLVPCLVPITDSWLAGNNPRELMVVEGSMTEQEDVPRVSRRPWSPPGFVRKQPGTSRTIPLFHLSFYISWTTKCIRDWIPWFVVPFFLRGSMLAPAWKPYLFNIKSWDISVLQLQRGRHYTFSRIISRITFQW